MRCIVYSCDFKMWSHSAIAQHRDNVPQCDSWQILLNVIPFFSSFFWSTSHSILDTQRCTCTRCAYIKWTENHSYWITWVENFILNIFINKFYLNLSKNFSKQIEIIDSSTWIAANSWGAIHFSTVSHLINFEFAIIWRKQKYFDV